LLYNYYYATDQQAESSLQATSVLTARLTTKSKKSNYFIVHPKVDIPLLVVVSEFRSLLAALSTWDATPSESLLLAATEVSAASLTSCPVAAASYTCKASLAIPKNNMRQSIPSILWTNEYSFMSALSYDSNNNNTQDNIYSAIIYSAKPYVRVHFESSEWKSIGARWPPTQRPSYLNFESACRVL